MAEPVTHPKDLAASLGSALLAWGIPSAVILATAMVDVGVLGRTMAWTGAMAWAGAACVFNAFRSGRLHCHITGPFFLLLAGAALVHGLGILSLGADGWRWIGLTFFVGGFLLVVLPDWIWGMYRADSRDRCY